MAVFLSDFVISHIDIILVAGAIRLQYLEEGLELAEVVVVAVAHHPREVQTGRVEALDHQHY